MQVQELAKRLGADVDPTAGVDITGVATLEEAGPQDVSFLANPKYHSKVRDTKAGAVLVAPDFGESVGTVLLRIGNPYLAFARAIEVLHPTARPAPGVHPTAVLGKGVVVGHDVSVGPYCVLGEGVHLHDGVVLHPHVVVYPRAEIGEGSVLHSFSVVREGVRLGRRTIVQNGAVLGADGFGFAPAGDGSWHKIPQVGTVVVADDVEIQANSCVDRAAVGATTIGRGTKIDNLVQVGHGSRVGEDTLLCGQVGLAGSTEVGNRVTLAGQVGVAGHLRIGDGATVAAQSGVMTAIPEGGTYLGSPAMPLMEQRRIYAATLKLPDLLKKLRDLEKRLEDRPPDGAPGG